MLIFCDVKVQVGASISSWFNQFFHIATAPRPWARKRPKTSVEKPATSNPKVDPVDQQLLKLLSDDPDDDIMLFLRSLAPQMRIVPADRQFSLRMEMMQLMIRYAQRPALKAKGGYKRQEVWPNISMCPKLAAFSLLHQKQRYWEHKLLLSDETYMKMFISTVCISLIGCISSQANSFW